MLDLLPDCRAKTIRGRVTSPIGVLIPIYCANCGADGGLVPEEGMTFAFYLCNKCAETHGAIAGMMMMPDEVFFEKLKQEQLASFGHYLSQQELIIVVENNSTPLARLLKEGA